MSVCGSSVQFIIRMETNQTSTIMITSSSSSSSSSSNSATATNLLLRYWTNNPAALPTPTGSEKFSHLLLAAGRSRRRRISPLIKLHRGFGGASIKCFARRRNSGTRDGEQIRRIQLQEKTSSNSNSDEYIVGLGDNKSSSSSIGDDDFNGVSSSSSSNNDNMDDEKSSISRPSRGAVLQACTITSGLLFALGLAIRQVSHFAYGQGWPVLDCSAQVSFGFETWHIELITGLVVVISSTRFLLLKTWPDFADSSEAANKQVLSFLQPLDYATVAFLPGISEEVLFRGALLPLFGTNWISALVVSAIFGGLHLGSGRRYSFAIWATCVGLAYSYATIVSGSLIVPMASHALNNLVGGILWRYSTTSMSTTAEEQEQN